MGARVGRGLGGGGAASGGLSQRRIWSQVTLWALVPAVGDEVVMVPSATSSPRSIASGSGSEQNVWL